MPHINIAGTEFHYNESGHGPAVVLLHGFPLDCRIWDAQVRELGRQNRVIALDLRGFGQTQSETPFTIDSLADDVHAFAQTLGLGQFILGGLSMGGYISFAYIKRYPADLRGLILCDTKCEADTSEGKAGRMKMIDACRQSGATAVCGMMLPKMLAESSHRDRPQIVALAKSIMEACPPNAIEHALLAMRDREDYFAVLPSICVPTLLVYGEGDLISPPSVGEAMSKHIPRSSLAIIPSAGHLSPMENPAAVNEAIGAFIAQC